MSPRRRTGRRPARVPDAVRIETTSRARDGGANPRLSDEQLRKRMATPPDEEQEELGALVVSIRPARIQSLIFVIRSNVPA